MQAVRQRVAGDLLLQGKRNALILNQLKPPPTAENIVYLRCAFVTRGPGDHIFPAMILDDWGKEIGSLKLYRWVTEHGERFPRAEIFGFERDGRDTQAFLREIELYARLPCYAYTTSEQPVEEGVLLNAILIPHASITRPQQIKRPLDLKLPLKAARVTWWQIPASARDIDLYHLDAEPDPGY